MFFTIKLKKTNIWKTPTLLGEGTKNSVGGNISWGGQQVDWGGGGITNFVLVAGGGGEP